MGNAELRARFRTLDLQPQSEPESIWEMDAPEPAPSGRCGERECRLEYCDGECPASQARRELSARLEAERLERLSRSSVA